MSFHLCAAGCDVCVSEDQSRAWFHHCSGRRERGRRKEEKATVYPELMSDSTSESSLPLTCLTLTPLWLSTFCALSSPIPSSLLSLCLFVSCLQVTYLLATLPSSHPLISSRLSAPVTHSFLSFSLPCPLWVFYLSISLSVSSLLLFFPFLSSHPLKMFYLFLISSSVSPLFSCMIWAPRPIPSPAPRAAWPPTAAVSTWAIRPVATGVAVTASGAPSAASVCPGTQDTSVKRVSPTCFLFWDLFLTSTSNSSMCSGQIKCSVATNVNICEFQHLQIMESEHRYFI